MTDLLAILASENI